MVYYILLLIFGCKKKEHLESWSMNRSLPRDDVARVWMAVLPERIGFFVAVYRIEGEFVLAFGADERVLDSGFVLAVDGIASQGVARRVVGVEHGGVAEEDHEG